MSIHEPSITATPDHRPRRPSGSQWWTGSLRATAEDVNVGDQATPGQPIAEPPERLGDRRSVKKRGVRAHATCNSSAATNTPRRRNAAGARTMASARAARVLNGNHSRRNDRDSDQDGPARSSCAARCSASAARNTSHRSSPVPGGSSVSSAHRAGDGSQLYSSRNSAINRHRSASSAPASKRPSLARLIGRYGRALAAMRLTVLHGTSITSILGPAQASLVGLNSGTARPPGCAHAATVAHPSAIQRNGTVTVLRVGLLVAQPIPGGGPGFPLRL
jgi:hypothetical protein